MKMTPSKILYVDDWPEMNLLKVSSNGLGASIFKLAAMTDATDAGYEVELLTTTLKNELLDQAYGISKIHTDLDQLDLASYEKVIFLGILEEELHIEKYDLKYFTPFTTADRQNYKSTPHIHFWREFCARSLGLTMPKTKAQAKLNIREKDVNEARKLLSHGSNWIAISLQVISALKDYGEWSKVIDYLLENNCHVLLLGNEEIAYKSHPQILNMSAKTDIHLLKALIAAVDAFTGNDGLNSNLAMFLGTPAVVLFSMISPESVIDPDQKLRSPITPLVNKGCPHQFCYPKIGNYRNAACIWNQEKGDIEEPIHCLQFSPEQISDEVLKLLE